MDGAADECYELIVAGRQVVAGDVAVLDLAAADGEPLAPRWAVGAHIDLVLPNGLIRQYSLCGERAERSSWRIAVRRQRDSRGGSAWVHENLDVGAVIRARGPRNNFPLSPASGYLFVAGGIGITPILPMLTEASNAGVTWRLLYLGRTAEAMPFAAELAAAYGDRVELLAKDRTGAVDLTALLPDLEHGTLVYCCGPSRLVDAVSDRYAGMPNETVKVERFVPAPAGEPTRPGPFEVELASTGERLTVPADRSVLEVLEEAGVPVLYSCSEGTCRTCETVVLDGEVDHRDSALSPTERESGTTMLICVSRARSDLIVLDL